MRHAIRPKRQLTQPVPATAAKYSKPLLDEGVESDHTSLNLSESDLTSRANTPTPPTEQNDITPNHYGTFSSWEAPNESRAVTPKPGNSHCKKAALFTTLLLLNGGCAGLTANMHHLPDDMISILLLLYAVTLAVDIFALVATCNGPTP